MATPSGPKPISEVKLGDVVLAYHEALDETGSYTVTDLISHHNEVTVDLTIDGERLDTTPEHAFFTQEQGWVPAKDLQVGMHVLRLDGTAGVVQSVLLVQQLERMYNLGVAEAHTFFVGDEQWLVHNCADYKGTFFKAYPKLKGKVVVHHAIEQQVLKRYPGRFTSQEIHRLSNLRGIPNSLNRTLHLSQIRRSWNGFYQAYPSATRRQIADHAHIVDRRFGRNFAPKRWR